MLTESQYKTLQVIEDYINNYGFAPTVSEIMLLMRSKSRSLVQRNLDALAEFGLINRATNRRRNIELLKKEEAALPLMGRIAAGQPIEAITIPEFVNIPRLLLGPNRYLLQVKGDSMIGDNICDGDLIICEEADKSKVREGDIVVALIDNESATLKRISYSKDKKTIRLIPSNPTLLPMEFQEDRVTIQGLYVGLLRIGHL